MYKPLWLCFLFSICFNQKPKLYYMYINIKMGIIRITILYFVSISDSLLIAIMIKTLCLQCKTIIDYQYLKTILIYAKFKYEERTKEIAFIYYNLKIKKCGSIIFNGLPVIVSAIRKCQHPYPVSI